jgi:pyrimidine operon attenuation protein/uracil phosphoribosyltransferase
MNRFSSLVFVFFFLIIDSSFAKNIVLFKSIQKVAEIVEDLCPMENCVVIGIGRSPTAIAAYLQLKHQKLGMTSHVWNVPLTLFRHGITHENQKLNLEMETKLFSHFDIYFPSKVELKGRTKILLIDYAITGETLVAARDSIAKYLNSRYGHEAQAIQLEMLGICDHLAEERGLHPEIVNRVVLDDQNWIRLPENRIYLENKDGIEQDQDDVTSYFQGLLSTVLLRAGFDPWSQYGPFDVLKDPLVRQKKRVRKQYLSLMEDLSKMMSQYEKVELPERSFPIMRLISESQASRRKQAHQVKYLLPLEQEKFYTLLVVDEDLETLEVAICNLQFYDGTSEVAVNFINRLLKSDDLIRKEKLQYAIKTLIYSFIFKSENALSQYKNLKSFVRVMIQQDPDFLKISDLKFFCMDQFAYENQFKMNEELHLLLKEIYRRLLGDRTDSDWTNLLLGTMERHQPLIQNELRSLF